MNRENKIVQEINIAVERGKIPAAFKSSLVTDTNNKVTESSKLKLNSRYNQRMIPRESNSLIISKIYELSQLISK